jgi:hypothetical protein
MTNPTWTDLPASYPQIFDAILQHSTHNTLLALRQASRTFEHPINKRLFRHITRRRIDQGVLLLDAHRIRSSLFPSRKRKRPDPSPPRPPRILLLTPDGKRLPAVPQWLGLLSTHNDVRRGRWMIEVNYARFMALLRLVHVADGNPAYDLEVDMALRACITPVVRTVECPKGTYLACRGVGIYFLSLKTDRMGNPIPAYLPWAPDPTRHVVTISFDPRTAGEAIDFGGFSSPRDRTPRYLRLTLHLQPLPVHAGEGKVGKLGPEVPLGVLNPLARVLRCGTTHLTVVGVESLPPHAIPALAHKCEGAATIPVESFSTLVELLKAATARTLGKRDSIEILTRDQYRSRVGEEMFALETIPPAI